MKNITICFYECEHQGDLDEYLNDIRQSDGKVIDWELNYEAETANVQVEVEDTTKFLKKFKETDGCDFSQFQDYNFN